MTTALNTTLFLTWTLLLFMAGFWLRHDAPIWGGF